MKIYSLGYLLKEGIRSLWTNRTMTLASVCVLISCLLLTGTAVLFSMNIATAMKDVENSNSITVYLDDNLPALKAVEVGEQLRQLDNIATCDYVPKDEALKDILEGMGDEGSVFEGLTGSDNFLPDAYRIWVVRKIGNSRAIVVKDGLILKGIVMEMRPGPELDEKLEWIYKGNRQEEMRRNRHDISQEEQDL